MGGIRSGVRRRGWRACLKQRSNRAAAFAGGGNWKRIGKVRYAVKGTRLEVAIPRKLLGLDPKQPLDLSFKWADNMQKPGDIMDFYLSGDVAPLGRFVWRWRQ